MLARGHLNASPDIQRVVDQIVKEDTRFTKELRTVHREPILLPVRFKMQGTDDFVAAFSRNLSALGACLVTDTPVPERTTATLEFYRLNEKVSTIVAESRWCRTYGPIFYMSGWQFVRLVRAESRADPNFD